MPICRGGLSFATGRKHINKISLGHGRKSGKVPEEPEYMDEEEVKSRSRGRSKREFSSNVVQTLNNLMGQLALEEREIKERELDPELKKEEMKRLRGMQRMISKVYLSYV